MVLLEIFSVALNSLFQQRKRKIILELTFAFLLNHAWISSESERNLESHGALTPFQGNAIWIVPHLGIGKMTFRMR